MAATDSSHSPAVLTSNPKLLLPSTTDPPSDTNPPTQKTWLIFGATGHIGRSLVKCALSHGDNVTAVGRTQENSMQQMQGWHARCLGLLCDVRVRDTVREVIEKSVEHWGKIDIIVNCTGYGVIGSCEDQDDSDLRSQFETNFLGTLHIIQLSLPHLRRQNSGRYLIFSSTSGALGVPGLGPYCATKYATEGLIESMLYEVDHFGIRATLVEPGHMRLDEPTGLDDKAPTSFVNDGEGQGVNGEENGVKVKKYGHFLVKAPSAPYEAATSPAGHARRIVQWLSDRQPTSAMKSAELVWQLGHCKYPPLRLLLGTYAVESVRDRLRSVIEEIEDWKHLHFPVLDENGKVRGEKADEDGNNDVKAEDDAMDIDEAGADIKEEEDDP
ncbi:Hypothetical predicted protein [Lecanosticta acicola]|uniref:Ketoreductase domain-containing protein n=1 Tax=Lecanosticta acicola TaxID=111012 RepID=A0AAI8YSU6_9PEZI|nr:Hypothetical predicted protein [Lecanosticta acicola]